jgi:hypothetical protein
MSVTAIRAPGNGRGTDIGFERRPVPGEARRIAANIAKLPDFCAWIEHGQTQTQTHKAVLEDRE